MKYAIMVYEPTSDFEKRTDPKHKDAYWGAYMAYSQALRDAGVAVKGGAALEPPTLATTVRLRADQRTIHDGPFADTKEQLGGMFVIDVPTLDEALKWAARCPAASTGCVEVRPIAMM
jgi:hypothetical protein